jgi:acetyl-CoA synthetase
MLQPNGGPAKRGYDAEKTAFQLDEAVELLDGNKDVSINNCVECCDRHVGNDKLGLRCVSSDGELREYTFGQLREMSARCRCQNGRNSGHEVGKEKEI